MNISDKKLAIQFIKKHHLKTIKDIIDILPKYMFHIWQEPEIFNTYRRRNNPNKNIKARKTYFEKKLKKLSIQDYLNFFINQKIEDDELVYNSEKIACSCREMAEVAGVLASVLLKKTIYILGNCLPLYALGRNKKRVYNHYCNAHIEGKRIIFFDSSIYKNIFDIKTHSRINKNLSLFSLVNIDKKNIYWKHFLQSKSNEQWFGTRELSIRDQRLVDTRERKKTKNWYFLGKIIPLATK